MIVDTIDNFGKYVAVNPMFKEVAEFLKQNDLSTLEPGKHIIDGDRLFVNVTTAKGREPDEAVIETHKRMIDIQIPLSGQETYGYTPLCDLPEGEYNEVKDITKLPGIAAQSYVTCSPGMFAIFFPQDGHAPCISSEVELKKVIFKVEK